MDCTLQVSGLEQFLAYKVGLVTGQFYEVLNDRDVDGFYRVVGFSTIVILCMVVILSLRQFVTRSMIVGWRREGDHKMKFKAYYVTVTAVTSQCNQRFLYAYLSVQN